MNEARVDGGAVCTSCRHVRVLHPGGAACRTPACTCVAFVPAADETPKLDTGPVRRVVSLEVPPGYVLSIQLIPIEPEPTDGRS